MLSPAQLVPSKNEPALQTEHVFWSEQFKQFSEQAKMVILKDVEVIVLPVHKEPLENFPYGQAHNPVAGCKTNVGEQTAQVSPVVHEAQFEVQSRNWCMKSS